MKTKTNRVIISVPVLAIVLASSFFVGSSYSMEDPFEAKRQQWLSRAGNRAGVKDTINTFYNALGSEDINGAQAALNNAGKAFPSYIKTDLQQELAGLRARLQERGAPRGGTVPVEETAALQKELDDVKATLAEALAKNEQEILARDEQLRSYQKTIQELTELAGQQPASETAEANAKLREELARLEQRTTDRDKDYTRLQEQERRFQAEKDARDAEINRLVELLKKSEDRAEADLKNLRNQLQAEKERDRAQLESKIADFERKLVEQSIAEKTGSDETKAAVQQEIGTLKAENEGLKEVLDALKTELGELRAAREADKTAQAKLQAQEAEGEAVEGAQPSSEELEALKSAVGKLKEANDELGAANFDLAKDKRSLETALEIIESSISPTAKNEDLKRTKYRLLYARYQRNLDPTNAETLKAGVALMNDTVNSWLQDQSLTPQKIEEMLQKRAAAAKSSEGALK